MLSPAMDGSALVGPSSDHRRGQAGSRRREAELVKIPSPDNVGVHPGGVAQLVERLTGSQEVRGFESHRLHSKLHLGRPTMLVRLELDDRYRTCHGPGLP